MEFGDFTNLMSNFRCQLLSNGGILLFKMVVDGILIPTRRINADKDFCDHQIFRQAHGGYRDERAGFLIVLLDYFSQISLDYRSQPFRSNTHCVYAYLC